ncbi:MAG TPA: hypothetical protein VK824_07680 [Planctomycetota bacterium]|nr:hypothetical protein [Planctomycetota bacterium]
MRVTKGVCSVLFACDLGQRIDLAACRALVADATEVVSLAHRHRVPTWFQFDTPPLRVQQDAPPIAVAGLATESRVETVLYDFGAASVRYELPFAGDLPELAALSCRLTADGVLGADAVRRMERLLDVIRPAVVQPRRDELLEDYFIFQVLEREGDEGRVADLPRRRGAELAAILRSEVAPLSDQEIGEALGSGCSFGPDDLTLIDWNAALVFDRDADDVRAVLEFANVQLLELRFLDRQLDGALDRAWQVLERPSRRGPRWLPAPGAELHRIGRMQVDAALLHERVSNALKLVGDQFLARVYGQAARRLRLQDWNASIANKLGALESIYTKLRDRAATSRLELLEWIVIALIALELLLPLLGVRH